MRVNIRSLMIAVAVVALGLAMMKVRSLLAFVPLVVSALGAPVLVWRGRLRTAGWGFAITAVAANVVYVGGCVAPDRYRKVILIAAWLLVVIPVCGGLGAAWAMLVTRRGASRGRAGWIANLVVLIATCLPLTAIWTDWPLYLAFRLARPEFERIADRVLSGQPVSFPRMVGLYRVILVIADRSSGEVEFRLESNPNEADAFLRDRRLRLGESARPAVAWWFPVVDLGGGWLYVDRY